MLVSKIFDLLMSLFDFLERLLQQLADTITNRSGIGDTALTTMSYLTMTVLLCLTAAFLWNLGEAVVHRMKHIGEANGIPWKNIKNCIFILIVGATCVRANRIFTDDPMGGSYMGISYPGIVARLDRATMARAMNTLAAVDIVNDWVECISDYGKDRDERIVQYIATNDPGAAAAYTKALQLTNDPNASATVRETLRISWEGAKAMTYGLATSQIQGIVFRALVNLCMYGLVMVVLLICSLLFIYHAGRTIILLAFYVKLAALLSMIVLPAAIGLLYFEKLRHAGIAVIKQIVVLMLVAGVMAASVQAVFSNYVIKNAITIAIRGELAPYAGRITDTDVMSFKVKTFTGLAERYIADIAPNKSIAMALQMTVPEAFAQILAIIKIMFILGTLLMIIGKLFDMVNGVMGEFWDPLAEGSKAA